MLGDADASVRGAAVGLLGTLRAAPSVAAHLADTDAGEANSTTEQAFETNARGLVPVRGGKLFALGASGTNGGGMGDSWVSLYSV